MLNIVQWTLHRPAKCPHFSTQGRAKTGAITGQLRPLGIQNAGLADGERSIERIFPTNIFGNCGQTSKRPRPALRETWWVTFCVLHSNGTSKQ